MKRQIALLTALFVLFLAIGFALHAQRGLTIADRFFRKDGEARYVADSQNHIAIARDGQGARFDAVLNGESHLIRMALEGQQARFLFEDGSVVEGHVSAGGLVDSDGLPIWFGIDHPTIAFGEAEAGSVWLNTASLASDLTFMYLGEWERRGEPAMLLLYAVLYAMGALSFLFPEQTFFLFSRWAYRSAELSDAGLLTQKIGGAVLIAAAILLTFLVF